MDYTVHGILEARILKWVALPFSRGLSQSRNRTSSALQADFLSAEPQGKPHNLWPHGLYRPWNSPGQNTGLGSLSLLQGIFPTQGLNPGLPHCRRILYQLSQQGKPKNTGVSNVSLLHWIFLTQESNWCLLNCRRILYQLSYEGSLGLESVISDFNEVLKEGWARALLWGCVI